VIEALHHEHNIFRMGGLRKELPIAFWTFLIGGSALAGLPLITAGYYSKDAIVWAAWAADRGSPVFWTMALIGVFLTSLYTYRLIFVVFLGEVRTHVSRRPGWAMSVPVIVLSFLSIAGGFDRAPFTRFMSTALPTAAEGHAAISETLSTLAAALMFAAGAFLAYMPPRLAPGAVARLWVAGWGFDWMYDRLFVRPVLWFARIDKNDFVDAIVNALAALTRAFWRLLSYTETGHLRWYAAGIAFGAVLFVGMVLLL
jgi:NADH-quinone oxidoreductase subunit L